MGRGAGYYHRVVALIMLRATTILTRVLLSLPMPLLLQSPTTLTNGLSLASSGELWSSAMSRRHLPMDGLRAATRTHVQRGFTLPFRRSAAKIAGATNRSHPAGGAGLAAGSGDDIAGMPTSSTCGSTAAAGHALAGSSKPRAELKRANLAGSMAMGRRELKLGPVISDCRMLRFALVTLSMSATAILGPHSRARRRFQFWTCSARLPPPGLPRGVVAIRERALRQARHQQHTGEGQAIGVIGDSRNTHAAPAPRQVIGGWRVCL